MTATSNACASSTAKSTRTSSSNEGGLRYRYTESPSLKEVLAGSANIQFGHRGEDVLAMQRALNAAGANPPLREDGLFGPKTQAALQGFQDARGLGAMDGSGVLGVNTLNALMPDLALFGTDRFGRSRGPAGNAPAANAPRPSGTVRAGDLAAQDNARRARGNGTNAPPSTNAPAETPAPVTVRPEPGQTPADAQLAQLQANAVRSAQGELAAGVREDPRMGNNRGARVDEYERRAGMNVGGEWCGYFTQFNYSQAAREGGGEFRGSLHSFQKARAFFAYRDYTNNSASRNAQLDQRQASDQAEGSARRFMVLEGSSGQRWAAQNNRPAESYNPQNLPIRPGDTILFNFGHVGMVEGYDPATGRLTTVEGNVGNRVQRKTYDLNDPAVRARIEGFGRPAASDFRS